MIKIINKIINIIYIIIIVLLLLYFGLRISKKIEIYNVETGSMEENIHKGDYILIYRQNDYKIGDVVTFKKNEYFVTHRVVEVEDDYITTKGDANNTLDDKIKKSSIVGKVIISGGILNIIIDYKFSIVGFLLALYLVTCYFVDNKKDVVEEKEEKEENNKTVKKRK